VRIAVVNMRPPSRARTIVRIGFAAATLAFAAGASTVLTQGGSSGPPVRTQQGMVQGMTVGNVEQFRGVPYAMPPVGDLRWKAPLPPKPYGGGTLQATSYPAPCMQAAAPAGFPPPNEDCLFLNLYRPTGSTDRKRMPVLMYIHGGGFGGGTASARDGTPLAATNDMIVITINYRLGVLGWLGLAGLDAETTNRSSSGNYGLLDMVASLRWVQENIAAFGGDRNNVTIAGTSVGGIGVCALMTAPNRERLFQKAIIESGECTRTSSFIVSHQAALLQGANFSAKAGCTDPATFTSCLRSKPAAALQTASAGLGAFVSNVGGHVMPKAPMQVIESGEMQPIPVIVGATHDEQKRNPLATTGFPATEQSYEKYLTTTFGQLAPLVAAEYPSKAFADPAYAAGAAASDSGIPNGIGVCPMLAELGSTLSKATKTFAYELNDPQGSVIQGFPGFEVGSLHTAEIGFLYAQIAPDTRTTEQMQLAGRMQRYWATFARDGRPMDGTREWSAISTGSGSVLRFQPKGDVLVPWSTMAAEHHCPFWAQLGY
jgi:para-nitrobenzyl esterase